MDDYSDAQTKPDKSNIISEVVTFVRQSGSFVRKDLVTDHWVYAEDLLCREKCSQCFRDALYQTYRSSNVAKKNKRLIERNKQQQQQRMPELEASHQAKRMRHSNPVAVASLPALPANLFSGDWESSPLLSPDLQANTVNRVSGLSFNEVMASSLFDSFACLGDTFEQDENPFEPTPFHSSITRDKKNFQQMVSFDPITLSHSSQFRRNSIYMGDDISAVSDMDDFGLQKMCSPHREQQQSNTIKGHYGANISAAFAAWARRIPGNKKRRNIKTFTSTFWD